MLLADIGVIESVPTVVASMYASDLVIGVDVGQDPTKVESCETALQVMMRIDDISEQLMRRHLVDAADVIVRPNVGGTPWYDFTKPEELISEGRPRRPSCIATIQRTHCGLEIDSICGGSQSLSAVAKRRKFSWQPGFCESEHRSPLPPSRLRVDPHAVVTNDYTKNCCDQINDHTAIVTKLMHQAAKTCMRHDVFLGNFVDSNINLYIE